MSESEGVKVNVGGVIFATTVTTLQGAKYFADQLALDPDLSKVLIDRDPVAFGYLLNCLRDHRYITSEKLQEYSNEIDYFGMDVLTRRLEENLPTIRVLEGSKCQVDPRRGLIRIKVLKPIPMVRNQPIDLLIECVLPYDGYIKLVSSRELAPGVVFADAGKPCRVIARPERNGIFPAGCILCDLEFHRSSTTCRVLS